LLSVEKGKARYAMTNSYIICTTARSGSNLVCDFCWNTKILGRPHEAFNPDLIVKRHAALGGQSAAAENTRQSVSINNYISLLKSLDTGKNGVFGTKILFEDFEHFLGFPSFTELLLSSNLIHLRRRSKIRQAVSYFFAENTGQWVASDNPIKDINEVEYNFDKISRHLERLVQQDTKWTNFLSSVPSSYQEIFFEDFLVDPRRFLAGIADLVGIDSGNFPVRSNLREQANQRTDHFVARFKKDWREKILSPTTRVFYKHTWFY
jgi:LPS sulfotransferase NodH